MLNCLTGSVYVELFDRPVFMLNCLTGSVYVELFDRQCLR